MANADAAFGLKPVSDVNGSPYNGSVNRYYVSSTDTTALFIGSPVIPTGGADSKGIPAVTHATASTGNYLLGAIVGVEEIDNNSLTFREASVARYVYVADDPSAKFEIQADAEFAAAYLGANANFVNASGSTVTGLSNVELQSTSVGTGATKQLRIVGVPQRPDNEIGSTTLNAKVYVKINLHSLNNTTGI